MNTFLRALAAVAALLTPGLAHALDDASIPTKIPTPFGNSAGGAFIRTIPIPSQIGIQAGAASFTDGFPPVTFQPVALGGVPPFGQDFNGVFNAITKWIRWYNAGAPIIYDGTFQSAIGGYPKYSIIGSVTTPGTYWQSTTDNNVTNPDAAGAGWTPFPQVTVANTTTNATMYPTFVAGSSGYQATLINTNFTFNPSTLTLTATRLISQSISLTTVAFTTNVALAVSQHYSGSGGSFQGNTFTVQTDDYNGGAAPANSVLAVLHDYGGPAMQGGRQSFNVQSVLTMASNPSNALKEYVSGSFLVQAQTNDGGSAVDVLSHTGGAVFGLNSLARLTSASTNFSGATGMEVNLQLEAGSSVYYATVAQFVTVGTHAVHGAYYDTSIAIGAINGSVGSNYGILFGPMHGAHPVTASGTLIGVTIANRSGSGTVPWSVANGIDFSPYTISGFFLKSANWSLEGTGHMRRSPASATLSGCGSGPVIQGSDLAGTIAVGSGTTSCTVAFVVPYANAPTCLASSRTADATFAYTPGTGGIAFTTVAGHVLDYICVASPNG